MRAHILSIFVCAFLLTTVQFAVGQVYPVRPVKIVAPFAAGGAADITSRLIADRLTSILQQKVVVENQQGGGGAAASQAVAQAAPDGYTLLYVTGATFVTAPIFARNTGYDPLRSFEPISLVSSVSSTIAVNSSFPARTLEELTALIKAAPGRYRYATLGPGSHSFIVGELFKSQTGLDIKEVTVKVPRRALQAVAEGEADFAFDVSVVVAVWAKEGRVRPLAVMGRGRSQAFPDVPTTVELGMRDLTAYVWSGLVAPARTPPEIVAVLNRAMQSVLSEIETQTTFNKYGMQAEGGTPDQFRSLIVAELTKWSRAVPLSATVDK